MSISASDLGDLIKTTQKELGELRYTDLSHDLQYYLALSNLMQESSVTFDAGSSIQWNLMTSNSGAAKQTSLFAVDSVNVGDVMATAEIPWRHTTTNYAIERREIAMNRDPRRIVDLVKVRRNDAMVSLTEHMEEQFWKMPPAGNDLNMYGVQYWVSDNAGANLTNGSDATQLGIAGGGFNGGLPNNGATTVAGISPTDVPRWQNHLAYYDANELDGTTGSSLDWNDAGVFPNLTVLQAMKQTYTKCNFKPIPNAAYPSYNPTPDKWGIYCGFEEVAGLEAISYRLNDAVVTRDIGHEAGGVMFRGVPVTYVPYLDNVTSVKAADAAASTRRGNPIYFLNWGAFRSVLLSGEYLKEQGPETAPNQHTVFTTHIDATMNIQCVDRRRNGLVTNGAVNFA